MAGGSQAVNETAGEVRLCGSTRVRDWRSYGSFARHGGGSCLSWSLAGPPAPSFIDRLKSVVATPLCTSDCSVPVGLERTRRFDLRRAEDAFGPLLDNMVSLLTTADKWRVRKCASCVLHFQDARKRGTRRWRSMQLGVNRLKVEAHPARE